MKIIINKLLVALIVIVAQQGVAQNKNNKLNVPTFSSFSNNATVDTGFWSVEKEGDNYCITMSNVKNREGITYLVTGCFDQSEFTSSNNSQTFELKRETGTLSLDGDITQEDAEGTFTFTRAISFENFLTEEGIVLDDELYYFKFFLGDIDASYISEITALGFQPTIRELGKLIWHDASVGYIESLSTLFNDTISLSTISKFAIHDVSVAFVEKARAQGHNFEDPYKYVQLKKHNNKK